MMAPTEAPFWMYSMNGLSSAEASVTTAKALATTMPPVTNELVINV